MSVRKEIQFGISATADFEENTWTFIIPQYYHVTAGEYALVPKENYDEATTNLIKIREMAFNGNLDNHDLLMKYVDEAIKHIVVGQNF